MTKSTRLFIAAFAAMLSLALLATSATASHSLSISPGAGTAVSATGSVSFGDTEAFRLRRVICNVTLNGAITKTIVSKATELSLAERTIAEITEGRTRECRDSAGGAA